jgi:hypothetical protein
MELHGVKRISCSYDETAWIFTGALVKSLPLLSNDANQLAKLEPIIYVYVDTARTAIPLHRSFQERKK